MDEPPGGMPSYGAPPPQGPPSSYFPPPAPPTAPPTPAAQVGAYTAVPVRSQRLAQAGLGAEGLAGWIAPLLAGAAFTTIWWAFATFADRVPIVLSAASGVAIGTTARIGSSGVSWSRGAYAAVVTALSWVVMIYLTVRSALVEQLGDEYVLPKWLGFDAVWPAVKGYFEATPLAGAAGVVAIGLAVASGAGVSLRD